MQCTTYVGWVGAKVGDLLKSGPLLEVNRAGIDTTQERQSASKDGNKHDERGAETKEVIY